MSVESNLLCGLEPGEASLDFRLRVVVVDAATRPRLLTPTTFPCCTDLTKDQLEVNIGNNNRVIMIKLNLFFILGFP